MTTSTYNFQTAQEMPYANIEKIKDKANNLYKELTEHLKQIKKDKTLFFIKGETVCIPDLHGDFVHLIITLHRHGVIDEKLNLKREFEYVFLGDFYDRAPDSDVIDHWVNVQIKNKAKIHRLIGNHEMAFFERDPNGYPVIFPSQDSIKDIANDFTITETLLKNIATGSIIAAYPVKSKDPNINLFVHSYVINDDYKELGLEVNSDVFIFAQKLNERLKIHGQYAYDIFINQKKEEKFDWKIIMKSFNDDPLFNLYKRKNDISTSFMWRRTGVPVLNVYPVEIDVDIPNDVYQIVGHTPVFSFALPKSSETTKPFIIKAKTGTGQVQFSDVGIGYHYKSDFERPEVLIKLS